jgi:hypothetical protein
VAFCKLKKKKMVPSGLLNIRNLKLFILLLLKYILNQIVLDIYSSRILLGDLLESPSKGIFTFTQVWQLGTFSTTGFWTIWTETDCEHGLGTLIVVTVIVALFLSHVLLKQYLISYVWQLCFLVFFVCFCSVLNCKKKIL